MRSSNGRFIGLFLLMLITGAMSAQTSVSPYSIFGNGERESGRLAQQIGMGGISAGLRDPLQLNIAQPASFSHLEYTTIEIGGFYQETRLTDGSQSLQVGNGGFSYLTLGFPVSDKWGLAIGISPYSKVGYDVRARTSYSFSDAELRYIGNGGFDRFYFGTGYEILEGLSVGVNGSYFFGSSERATTAIFDNPAFYHVTREENISATGFSWDAGVQYVMKFGPDDDRELVLGASFVPKTVMKGSLNDLSFTFTENSAGRIYRDTVYSTNARDIDVVFNSNYSVGFTYGGRHEQLIQYAWSFGADYQILNRNELNSSSEVRGEYVSGFRASVGGSLIPYFAFDMNRGSYFSQVDYRVGAYYENTGLRVNGEVISDAGVSFGMGFPIGRRIQSPGDVKLATLNFGMIVGKRGTRNSGNIEETFARFVVGLTLNDKWFTQFKYR